MDEKSLTADSPGNAKQTDILQIEEIEMLDDQELEILSPSVHVPDAPPNLVPQLRPDEFQQSVCFTKCHNAADFSPSDKTKNQWRLLIEQNGHAIFEGIEWEDPQQKTRILDYLLQHAGNSKTSPEEGIGVWE